MKLRLDRVLKVELVGMSEKEALAAGEKLDVSKMKMPAKWTAPYGAYSAGWWEVFYPKH